jgi:hypothetical protein
MTLISVLDKITALSSKETHQLLWTVAGNLSSLLPLKRLSQYEAFHLLHNESSIGMGSPNLMVDLEALMIWSLCSSNKRDLERLL